MTSDTTSRAAVLFDIDGTLVDSTYHHAMAWHSAFRRYDVSVPLWRVHRTVGMGGDKLVRQVAGDDVERRLGDQLRDAWAEEYTAVLDTVAAFDGAAALVRRVTADGLLVALASSGEPEFTEAAIRRIGIDEDEIGVVTTAADVEDSKPDPDLLGVTLDKLGADRAVMVGDTPYDVAAADRLGLPCVALLTGGFSRAELESAGATLVVESLAELMDLDWHGYTATRTTPEEDA